MKKNYLAFDLGASSGRAILGELSDGKLSLSEIHRFSNGPIEKDGSLFWDFDAICKEIKTGLKKALLKTKDISSIAVDTWGVDYILLKKNGKAARLPYHYRDARTDKTPEKVFSIVPAAEIYRKTGIQYMQLNTLYQLFEHGKKHPEDFDGSTLLLIPDALTYMLCGDRACEYTEASTSNLLDAKEKNWDFELIEKLGLPSSVFPRIAMPCTAAGKLTRELQKELSCSAIPVMRAGSHDTASAVASVPAPHGKKWAYVSCGTWALLGAELDGPMLSEKARIASFTNEGGLDGKIRFLTNIMGTWLLQETKRVWEEKGRKISYPEMGAMAMKSGPLRFLINPNDKKFLSPGDMPGNIRDFCMETGQGEIPDDNAVLRCVYDSLALCFRVKLEELQALLGVKYECLNIVGGGTKDRTLMQLAADCLGIAVAAGPVEATSIGNIIGQAMADGTLSNLAEAREIVRSSFDVEDFKPSSGNAGAWDSALKKFKKLCQA